MDSVGFGAVQGVTIPFDLYVEERDAKRRTERDIQRGVESKCVLNVR